MASPIETRGFQVSVMPQYPQMDPRLLTPAYDRLIPAFAQGLGAANQFMQLREDQAMRPVRQELANLQLQAGRENLAMMPLRRDIQMAQLDEARKNAAALRILPGSSQIVDTTQFFPAALDEEGRPTGEGESVLGDLVQLQDEEVFGPGGTRTTRQTRRTVKTADQRAAERAAAQSLDEYRDANAETARVRAENDALKAEAARLRAEAAVNDPNWRNVSSGVDSDGNLVLNQMNSLGQLRSVPTGQKPRADNNFFGGISLLQGGGGATPPVANSPTPAASDVDPDIAAILGGAPAASAPAAYNSIADAEAAAARGQLRPGQRVTIGGVPGTWQ